MLNAPASGCGPGISRPADTQQEGVRSAIVRKVEREVILDLRYLVSSIRVGLGRHTVDWPAIARAFQRGADMAGRLSHHYRNEIGNV